MGKEGKSKMNETIMSKEVQRIYTYLVNEVADKEVKKLITYLKDYVYNGSFVEMECEDECILTKGIRSEVQTELENTESEMICKLTDEQFDKLVTDVTKDVMEDNFIWEQIHQVINEYASKYVDLR